MGQDLIGDRLTGARRLLAHERRRRYPTDVSGGRHRACARRMARVIGAPAFTTSAR